MITPINIIYYKKYIETSGVSLILSNFALEL